MKNTRILKWLALATCIVMFLATFGGGVVTRTDSGLGCGSEWPTCNGKFVPAHTIASVIEFSHRLVSGLAGILSIATFAAFLIYFKKRRDLQFFSLMTLLFVIIQGIMGAMAVVFSQSTAVMALHFGFALIAFASASMMTLGAWQADRDTHRMLRHDRKPVSRGFRNFIWASTVYTYIAVYTGAFLSHSTENRINSFLGIAPLSLHQIAAGVLFFVILAVGHFSYRKHPDHGDIRALGVVSVILIALQIVVGIALLYTAGRPELYMFVVLSHMLIIAALFAILCYMSYRVWQLSPEKMAVQNASLQRT
ncbi:COX15/CtaA family protein [Paenibacillus sp. P96]|uniref:COX15/CtaA family protein n=1 Tax=Paenibacillus zeirhizosphaerae TaxID=2987519 RepID=A0ABT9FUS4_9BACL|nr:COX15/CtaA family protein [Paenibacillus sp. P96]MDP4098424.1 COX15/CtaA family protein [Paenibacillus sp. P96]